MSKRVKTKTRLKNKRRKECRKKLSVAQTINDQNMPKERRIYHRGMCHSVRSVNWKALINWRDSIYAMTEGARAVRWEKTAAGGLGPSAGFEENRVVQHDETFRKTNQGGWFPPLETLLPWEPLTQKYQREQIANITSDVPTLNMFVNWLWMVGPGCTAFYANSHEQGAPEGFLAHPNTAGIREDPIKDRKI